MINKLKESKGFTLIELIIVVVILGILILIVLAATRGDKDKASDAQIMADAARVQTALEDCFETNSNTYPAADMTAVAANACVSGKFDNGVPTSGLAISQTTTADYALVPTTSKGAQPALNNKQ